MKFWVAMILTGCTCVADARESLSPILSMHVSSATPARASTVTIELLVINPNEQALHYAPDSELTGTLRADQHAWVVTLHPAGPVATTIIPAGQHVSIPYLLTLPGDAGGRILLEVAEVPTLQVALDIQQDAAPTGVSAESLMASMKEQEQVSPPAMSRIQRTFASRLGLYGPIYFLYGDKAPAIKFQFSFRYRLIGEDSKYGALIPPYRGFYLAYTQRSLWDIDARSSPFYDTSYMPEMFFEWLAPQISAGGGFHWIGMQTGVQHESNGKDGADSRSLNIAYVRASMSVGRLDGWNLLLMPRVFTYLGTSDDNADIAQYRGYGEFRMAAGKNDSVQLAIAFRIGTGSNKGGVQVDLTQPVRIPLINLQTYLQLQYFDGYGESLLSYNQKSTVWRLGMAFVR